MRLTFYNMYNAAVEPHVVELPAEVRQVDVRQHHVWAVDGDGAGRMIAERVGKDWQPEGTGRTYPHMMLNP